MHFNRTASLCAGCPLRDSPRVWSEGPVGGPLMLVGEAPGAEEEAALRPFVGRAGQELDRGLGSAHLHRPSLWVTNLVCCRLPSNDWNSLEAKEAQEACRPGFEQELAFLKPRVLGALGNNVMHALGIAGGITKNRGSVYDVGGTLTVPTWHPSYIQRMRYSTETSIVYLRSVWIADLKKMKRIAYEQDYKRLMERFELAPTVERVEEFVQECIGKRTLIAVDVETTSLDPAKSKLVVVGLADTAEHCLSVPFLRQFGHPYWPSIEESRVRAALQRLFSECNLAFQSATFDLKHLRSHGYVIPWQNIRHDTLLLHHALIPELPHNLAFIVSIYGNTPYWKENFRTRDGSILDMDDTELRSYNARDCVVLHQVIPPMLDDLRDQGSEETYVSSLRLIRPITKMEEQGILLDPKALIKWRTSLETKLEVLEKELRSLGGLPEAFNLASGDDLRFFLYGIAPRKFEKITGLSPVEKEVRTFKCELCGVLKEDIDKRYLPIAEDHNHVWATISSSIKLLPKVRVGTKVYTELMGLKTIHDTCKPLYLPPGYTARQTQNRSTDTVSTDKNGLLSLRIACEYRLKAVSNFKQKDGQDEAEKIEHLLKWLGLFADQRETGKLLSTYTTFPMGDDGRVHTHYLIHGTTSGRLSSASPNLQNIPPEARHCFVAQPGHTFMSADYDNLEVRVLAYEMDDPVLIAQLERGENIHDLNTQVLFGVNKDDKNWFNLRAAAKIWQFGRNQYGGGDRKIYEQIIAKSPGVHLTFADFKEATRKWECRYSAYRPWRNALEQRIREHRKVTDAFGRTRQLLGSERDIVKEGINHMIQAPAAHIKNQALIAIDNWLEANVPTSHLVLDIHDQLVLEVPLEDLKRVRAKVKAIMEAPIQYRNRTVSFPVSLSSGSDWNKLK